MISDTHGVLRPEAAAALAGVDVILHAGDIGGPDILDRLRRIAPVAAVRGNMDFGSWAAALPVIEVVTLAGAGILLAHQGDALDADPVALGCRAVVSGHTHRPSLEEREGVLYLNPGSAGRARFGSPSGVAFLEVHRGRVAGVLVPLDPGGVAEERAPAWGMPLAASAPPPPRG
ncbi:metallophosphoesterase family protein [Dissulfurirhabdus thermomarina]|uniref:metallophosphoesterase family protein n=1 Tax=Dissulfurirhabdus thermomarina TaxID=1765737 RepID=UPI0031B640FF